MDPQELRGLMEAYSKVYSSQEEIDEAVKGADPEMRKAASAERRSGDKPLSKGEGEKYSKFKASQISYIDKKTKGKYIHGMTREETEIDEATAMAKRGYDEAPIRQKIAKSTGGGEAADRASALEKQSTFGDAKKAKARQELARKQRGDFRKTTSSSPGLHGYAHKSDDPGVKAKQAARGAQRGALTPAEKKQLNREEFDIFDVVLEFLQTEGYAETLEEAEWMMANVIDKEAIEIILDEEHLDEAIKNPESRKKLRAMMDREVRKGDKSKGENPRSKYPTEKGKQAFHLLVGKNETGSEKAPVRKRGGTNAPSDERVGKGPNRAGNAKYWAGVVGPSRDRGAGNKAARRAGTYKD